MNEQLQKILKQALSEAAPNSWEDISQDRLVELLGPLQEKFSELIVRECADICRERKMTPSAFTADELLEHFGVEE